MRLLNPLILAALLPISAFAQSTAFESPSGNIHCEAHDDMVACFIHQTQTGNDGCAYIIEAYAPSAYRTCAADGGYDGYVTTLGYGNSIRGQGWTCTSQQTGMYCVNHLKKGFKISRSKQIMF